jgi:hypothetical protein
MMADSHKKRKILATTHWTNTMEHSPSEVKSVSYSRTSQPSVEPGSSVPCPQQLDIGPMLILNPVLTLGHDFHKIQFSAPPSMPVFSKTVFSLELFQPKLLCAFLISPIRAICPAHHILLNFTTLKIFGDVYKLYIFRLCSFLQPPGNRYFRLNHTRVLLLFILFPWYMYV